MLACLLGIFCLIAALHIFRMARSSGLQIRVLEQRVKQVVAPELPSLVTQMNASRIQVLAQALTQAVAHTAQQAEVDEQDSLPPEGPRSRRSLLAD
jgi:hypothetical protein